MSETIASVLVEHSSTLEVASFLNRRLNFNIKENFEFIYNGTFIQIHESATVIEWAKNRLNELELEEESEFYRNFDLNSFNIEISFSSRYRGPLYYILPFFADYVGFFISKEMKHRTLVMFDEQDVPFCIYHNGKKERDFKEYYKEFFCDKLWIPRE